MTLGGIAITPLLLHVPKYTPGRFDRILAMASKHNVTRTRKAASCVLNHHRLKILSQSLKVIHSCLRPYPTGSKSFQFGRVSIPMTVGGNQLIGRSGICKALIREASVVGLTPRSSAAPPAP